MKTYRWLPLALLAALLFGSPSKTRAASYTLTLVTNGSGSVLRNPTNSPYPSGSVVTVTAIPSEGWNFSQWSGDASGNANPLNVTMTSNKVITAEFQLIGSFTLTTSVNGMGSVSLDPPGGSYPSNSVVNATALPAAGWVFVNWSGDAAGSANPVAITMNQNKTVTANFAQPPTIDTPPQNASTVVGGTTNFTVHAVGTAPLFYQWWFNGSKVENATTTILTLSNIQPVQEGPYSITVTNAYGVASNFAQLIITDACVGTNVVSTPSESALRNAIQIGGTVSLCFNGVITLTNTIAITNDVALDARNRSVVISGNDSVRLFSIGSGASFSATNLILAHGRHVGADGADAGAQPPENGFPGEGAAILNTGGSVYLSGCTLVSNVVIGGMAGSMAFPYPTNGIAGEGRGGAILVRGGSLWLDSVTLSNNSATGGPGVLNFGVPLDRAGNARGGAIYVTNGSVFIANGNLRSNLCLAPWGGANGVGAKANGGAIFLASGEATLTNCSVVGNVALGEKATVSSFASLGPSAAYGGALALASGTATIRRCEFTANQARGGDGFRSSGTGEAQGGALFSSATILAQQVSFYQNSAVAGSNSSVNLDARGGACYSSGPAVFDGCSFVSNWANGGEAWEFGGAGAPPTFPGGSGFGGGLYNVAQLNMTNCTIALNSTVGGAGLNTNGSGGNSLGGGLYNTGAFFGGNVTIASNSVGAVQGGIFAGANVANTNGSLGLYNSILAYPGASSNAMGIITDAGFNISSDGSANFSSGSSFNFTDPLLQAPANNGGSTLTMALSPDSPAVDFGSSNAAPAIDQRGFPRPFGLGFDIGAYERQGTPSQSPTLQFVRQIGAMELSFQAESNVFYSLQRSSMLGNWTELELIGPYPYSTNVRRSINFNGPSPSFFRLFIP